MLHVHLKQPITAFYQKHYQPITAFCLKIKITWQQIKLFFMLLMFYVFSSTQKTLPQINELTLFQVFQIVL